MDEACLRIARSNVKIASHRYLKSPLEINHVKMKRTTVQQYDLADSRVKNTSDSCRLPEGAEIIPVSQH
ncbi:Hypothetical predicted protein [Cloeon dipterum]|uniref:Uncharacterized protein n=1 Tax=Cloeon dipterum TaxID=197152 RepID=A0A8S1CIY8_9INSE|nr:Hypothetical predicted protein [Cloeon dipterum]